MTRVLTQDAVDSALIPLTRKLIADRVAKGLYLDLWPKGKAWRFRFTGPDKKTKSITIGDASTISLEVARRQANALGAIKKTRKAARLVQAMPTYANYVNDHYLPFAYATKRGARWEQIILRLRLLPAFGDMELDQITKPMISGFVQEKVSKAYSPGTVNRMLAVFKTSLNRAVEWEIGGLQISPARAVRLLRDPPKIDRFLDFEEAQRLIQAVRQSESPMLQYIIPFLLFTGARKREALDAKWQHIDFDNKRWTIPFTKAGKPRYVPLSDQALRVLAECKLFLSSSRLGNTAWIFPNPQTGEPYTSIYYPWDLCRKAAGLPEVRIHDLRHSFASALVNRGMTLYDVKELLGHANVSTTQRYAHLSKERLHLAAQEAGRFYEG